MNATSIPGRLTASLDDVKTEPFSGRTSSASTTTEPRQSPTGVKSQSDRRRPRRTVRLRLSVLYGSLFFASGAALLAITYALVSNLPLFLSAPSSRPHPGGPVGLPPGADLSARLAAQRTAELHQLLVGSGLALMIMTGLSAWLGWVVAGRVLRPLRTITAATRLISQDNLNQRLVLKDPEDELYELGDTINGLLARLEAAFDTERSFIGNAAHELRTPIAMMKTSIEVAEARPWPLSEDATTLIGKVREGLDQAERLVDSFLILARAQRGMVSSHEPVPLAEILADDLLARVRTINTLNLVVHKNLRPATVTGSHMLLARLAANLLDNAVQHNESGGVLAVTTETTGGLARLTVESGGCVIDPQTLEQLVRPFRRRGADRTGSENGLGLGLTIVDAIATAHRGRLELNARPQGGLKVVVELPAGSPRSAGARQ